MHGESHYTIQKSRTTAVNRRAVTPVFQPATAEPTGKVALRDWSAGLRPGANLRLPTHTPGLKTGAPSRFV